MNGDFHSLNLFSREFRDLLQDLADNAVRRDQLDFGPNMLHRNIPGSSLFVDALMPVPERREPVRLAKITALGTNDGEYKGTQVRPDGTAPDTPIVWDGTEGNQPVLNLVGGPPANIDDIVRVHTGTDSGGNPYPWFVSCGPAFFPVTVSQTGGSDGTGTTAASYTYTVTSMGGVELGTSVGQEKPRPNGKMTAGSSYGVAFYDGDTLKLWDAGEVEATNECE